MRGSKLKEEGGGEIKGEDGEGKDGKAVTIEI